MPAYAKEMYVHSCGKCTRRATHRVYDTHNGFMGHFCATCAKRMVETLNREDD